MIHTGNPFTRVVRGLASGLLIVTCAITQAQGVLLHQLQTGELDYFVPSTPYQSGAFGRVDDFKCDFASGCAGYWRFLGSSLGINYSAPDVSWFDPVSGRIEASTYWLEYWPDGTPAIHWDTPAVANWTCTQASGCSSQWMPVGIGSFDLFQGHGVLWFNPGSGQLSAWIIGGGGTVVGTVTLSATCGAGCSNKWVPVATGDFNGDHHTDILWFDRTDGLLGIWYLDGAGNVTSTTMLSWTCDSNCSSVWQVVGSADFDRDGKDDVVWWNSSTGEIGYWKVGPSGAVLNSATYPTLCALAWGCRIESTL